MFERLRQVYEDDLRLLANPSCDACDARIRHPVAVWHVGRDYANAPIRVLFVGKPHRGKPGTPRPSGLIDPREMVETKLRGKAWPYWNYTLEIARLVHGTEDAGWDRIAMTNIVKCTNVDAGAGAHSADTTSLVMVERCAADLGVISAEIRLLRPTHLVLYTASFYPRTVQALSLGASTPWRDAVNTDKACGRKALPWREREAEASWGGPLRMLITGHPERMNRAHYTSMVAEWVTRVARYE